MPASEQRLNIIYQSILTNRTRTAAVWHVVHIEGLEQLRQWAQEEHEGQCEARAHRIQGLVEFERESELLVRSKFNTEIAQSSHTTSIEMPQ